MAFRKSISLQIKSLELTPSITTKSLEKLKIILIQENVSHAIQHIAFAVKNLFAQHHSEVIKPTKRLKSTIESTVKAASLFIHLNALFVTFNMFVNQKHHSTLGSTTTEKTLKIPMQHQLTNISTTMIVTLTIAEKSLS